MKLAAPTLFVVVSCGLLLGCSGSGGSASGSGKRLTHDEYQRAIVGVETSSASTETGRLFFSLAVGDLSDADCRTGARRFADDIHTIIDSISAIHPPDDALDLQQRLLDAARKSAAQLDALASDVESGKVACGEQWNHRAYGLPSTTRALQVIEEAGRRGYQLGLNSE
jgi:hypothetical protein